MVSIRCPKAERLYVRQPTYRYVQMRFLQALSYPTTVCQNRHTHRRCCCVDVQSLRASGVDRLPTVRAEELRRRVRAGINPGAKPITQVSTKAWYGASGRAGIENFHRHDLRHTWASWHVQQGAPSYALQELGGWESPEMVRRYAHLAADHLVPYADRLCALRVVEEVPED